tara:strand:+ start:86 stop:382 length:297 start_codon:yes stop_codon:yes gene_type:complete
MALTEQTKKQLDEYLQEKKVLTEKDIEHNHEEKHNHAVRSFDKFCPDCATKNPDFKEPDFFCKDCLTPIGTQEDLNRVKVCHNCGFDEAITKEEKEQL